MSIRTEEGFLFARTKIYLLKICGELDGKVAQPDAEFCGFGEVHVYAFEVHTRKDGVTPWTKRSRKLRTT